MTPNSDGSSENLGNEGGNSWWYKEVWGTPRAQCATAQAPATVVT
jgi:hypothetical protein